MLGGIGHLPGAMLGGFLLGVVESIVPSILGLSAQLKDAVAFVILVLVIILRPQGIFSAQADAESA
jgi:branched-chain amino acid transport system permease protein